MNSRAQTVAPLPPDGRCAPRRLTVVRPGALGDTLLTLPALAALRRWAPEARLTFIARADTLPLAQASGLTDCAWSWDSPDWSVIFASEPMTVTEAAQSALGDADVVIVWASDPDAMIARRLASLGAKRVIVAPALPPEDATSAGERAHIAVWLIGALAPLGIPTPSVEAAAAMTPTLRAPAPNNAEADAIWHALRLPERVVALHPGSGSPRKRWPADRFAEVARLAREAGYAPLLLAGEADDQALAETQTALTRMGVRADVARGL
ncbi:MAG TPA: glycosyltransferase family 9 protein, partial [Ktedonobacterales bacterium]|nr:glycosyltransferase family 9 protein [Ktedonobacterales bacterium]